MKALVYAGPKRVEVQEVKEPEKQDGKVKLNIRYCRSLWIRYWYLSWNTSKSKSTIDSGT